MFEPILILVIIYGSQNYSKPIQGYFLSDEILSSSFHIQLEHNCFPLSHSNRFHGSTVLLLIHVRSGLVLTLTPQERSSDIGLPEHVTNL